MEHSYNRHTVREFLLDSPFRRWVVQPNEPSMTFGPNVMLTHPEQQALINEATLPILFHPDTRYVDQHRYRTPKSLFIRLMSVWKKRLLLWQPSLPMCLLTAGGAVWYALKLKQQRITLCM